jgi:hypothetical protein
MFTDKFKKKPNHVLEDLKEVIIGDEVYYKPIYKRITPIGTLVLSTDFQFSKFGINLDKVTIQDVNLIISDELMISCNGVISPFHFYSTIPKLDSTISLFMEFENSLLKNGFVWDKCRLMSTTSNTVVNEFLRSDLTVKDLEKLINHYNEK